MRSGPDRNQASRDFCFLLSDSAFLADSILSMTEPTRSSEKPYSVIMSRTPSLSMGPGVMTYSSDVGPSRKIRRTSSYPGMS